MKFEKLIVCLENLKIIMMFNMVRVEWVGGGWKKIEGLR